MKNASQPFTQISIPSPCGEDWTGMEVTESGRFCNKCEKSVIDFTHFTDQQLQEYLELNRNTPLCGRIPISKLNKPMDVSPVKHRYKGWWIWAALAGSSLTLQAQVESEMVQVSDYYKDYELSIHVEADTGFIHLKGFLEDRGTSERLPFAFIEVTQKSVKCVTDVNGEFVLEIPANLNPDEKLELTISYVGYKTKRIDFIYSQLVALQGTALQLQLDLAENIIIGEIICVRPPWHKRVWYKVKRVFKRKHHEIE
jgi:hypothetical protein